MITISPFQRRKSRLQVYTARKRWSGLELGSWTPESMDCRCIKTRSGADGPMEIQLLHLYPPICRSAHPSAYPPFLPSSLPAILPLSFIPSILLPIHVFPKYLFVTGTEWPIVEDLSGNYGNKLGWPGIS